MIRTALVIAVVCVVAGCSQKPEQPIPLKPKPQAEAPAPAASAPVATAKVEEPKPDPNKELAQRVKRALEGDAKVQGGAIDVTAADGKVTLWGTAGTSGERSHAAQAAAKVDGVTSVENKISVVKGS